MNEPVPIHPCEVITQPKGEHVFVLVARDGDYAEDTEEWVVGVFTDRRSAERIATQTVCRCSRVLTMPLNKAGRHETR